MTKKPVLNAPPPFEPLRGLSLPRSQSNGAQVHQVHKPDWSMWSGDQRVAIEEAVSLTMDIDPTPLLRVQDFITPESFPEDRRADFSKRQAALKRKFNGRTSSMLSDAVHYATQKEWSGLPPELVAMATVPPDTTPQSAKAESAPKPTSLTGLVVHKARARPRDILDPVIERALAACSDSRDTAAVFVMISEFAVNGVPPLLDATPEGIRYTRDGKDTILTRDALNKRLKRR